ncbi:MAG: calcium-binding protein, partial [Acinetobacter sp.]
TAAQIAAKVNSSGGGTGTPNPVGDTIYNYTSGALTITEQSGTDKIVFASGITFSQISSNLTKSGNDLIIKVNGSTTNIVTVKSFFLAGNYLVEMFQTAVGEQITANQIFTVFGLTMPSTGSETPNPVGDTTYNYTSGALTITEQSGTDKVVFASGITFSQISSNLTKSGNDLIIKVNGNTANIVTVKNFFLAGNYLVETFQTAAGEQITANQIFTAFGLTMPGTGGGIANAEGDTTYNYASGDLTITEVSGNDKVVFASGITFSQIGHYLTMSGNDLILKVNGSNTNKVTVKNFFLAGNNLVETFQFATGEEITAVDIFGAFGLTLPSTGGGTETGSSEVDGDTTYEYTTGALTINEVSGNDKVIFKNGITFSQIGSYLNKSGNDLILKLDGSNTNKVTVKDFFLGGDYVVETFAFETGGQITASQIFGAFGLTMPAAASSASVARFNFDEGNNISSDQVDQAFGMNHPFNAEDLVQSVITGDAGDNLFISDSAVSELFILNEGQDIIKLMQNTSGVTAVDYANDFKISEDQLDLSEFLDNNQVNSSNLDEFLNIFYDENLKTNTISVTGDTSSNSQEILVLINQAEFLSVQDLLLNQSIVY